MPKKAGAARVSAPRNRAKVQKSFELVRPEGEPRETVETPEEVIEEQPRATPASNKTATAVKTKVAEQKTATAVKTVEENEPEEEKSETAAPRGSAAARIAARRQAAQRAQQRSAASLITAEHFSYVQRDLIVIGILATIMFAAIIILYFTIGRG